MDKREEKIYELSDKFSGVADGYRNDIVISSCLQFAISTIINCEMPDYEPSEEDVDFNKSIQSLTAKFFQGIKDICKKFNDEQEEDSEHSIEEILKEMVKTLGKLTKDQK